MAELNGRVNDSLEAFVTLRLLNGDEIECLIDTGFNGALLLPHEFVERNELPIVAEELFTGVERLEITAEIALAEISWLGDEFQIQVAVSETGSALLGTDMLVDCKLEIDYFNFTLRISKYV